MSSSSRLCKYLLVSILILALILSICEFSIYYYSVFQCRWPSSRIQLEDENTLKVMILADTHLLGPVRGHPFDKLRREWQMHRSFQSAIQVFKPELVIFLGDLFDEGLIVSNAGFQEYVTRFNSLFSVPENVQVLVLPGNHDIGFHLEIKRVVGRESRFNKAFNSTAVSLQRLKGVSFVLLDSMALDDDGCSLCLKAQRELRAISEQLKCDKMEEDCKSEEQKLHRSPYTRPVLLQHFPMYRDSDSACSGSDSAPDPEKHSLFRPKMDCLSREGSGLLLEALSPRLILSGHTHHGCLVMHKMSRGGEEDVPDVPEYSVPSFNWRNRNDPSFFLGLFTRNDYELEKCFLPEETTVKSIYLLGTLFTLTLGIYHRFFRVQTQAI